MKSSDHLLRLLIDFFNLPPDTCPKEITQQRIAAWDSLAMVQLIADLQGTFIVDFDLTEIERLRSYNEIREALSKKGALTDKPIVGDTDQRLIVSEETE